MKESKVFKPFNVQCKNKIYMAWLYAKLLSDHRLMSDLTCGYVTVMNAEFMPK